MKKYFDLERLEALRMLDILSKEELLGMAKAAVQNGCDDPEIFKLSICNSDDDKKIAAQFDEIKNRCIKNLMTMSDALRIYAKEISALIVSGVMSPLEGSRILWRAQVNSNVENFNELDGFIYAASEMDDRPEDWALFEEGILREAKRMMSIGEFKPESRH